jgi:hypothetical protein
MARQGWIVFVLAALLPLPLMALLLTGFIFDPAWPVPVFHFFVVTLTSSLAFILAAFMLTAAGQLKDARVFFLSLGFIAIAGFFIVHALTTPGALFVGINPWVGLSAHLSLLGGAIMFALGAVYWKRSAHEWIIRHQTILGFSLVWLIVVYAIVALGTAEGPTESTIATAPAESAVPSTFGYSTTATPTPAPVPITTLLVTNYLSPIVNHPVFVNGVSIIALLLFAFVCFRQASLYRLARRPLQAGFLVSSLFLFQAQISMSIAPIWHASWWEYHGLMLAAFGAAILGLAVEYSQGGNLSGMVEGLMLRDTISQLQRGYTDVVVVLVETIEAKDPYTRGHTQRVSAMSVRIGETIGLSPDRLRVLHRAATLHDIGKIGVPDSILNKPGRLTEEEFAIIKEHPVRGHQIIRNVRSLRDEVGGVRQHHERLDGSGYPDGLKGDAISLDARIIAVADVFDALTSARAYRDAWSRERALAQIESEAGTKLDKRCVEALQKVCRQSPSSAAQPSLTTAGLIEESVPG